MQITVDVTSLRAALKKVQAAAKGRTTLPVLGHLLLTASDSHAQKKLSLRATDLCVDVTTQIPAALPPDLFEYGFDPGECLAPAKLFSEIVNDLKSGVVQVSSDSYSGKTILQRPDASSKYMLDSLPPEEFPSGMKEGDCFEEFLLAEDVLPAAIERALAHVANPDEADRVPMQGIRFTVDDREEAPGTVVLHATNGRTLWQERLPLLNRNTRPSMRPRGTSEPCQFVLHNQPLARALPAINGVVRVRVDGCRASILSAAGSSSMQLLEGKYPEIERVLDFPPGPVLEVDREAFQAALARVVRCAKEEKSPNLVVFDLSSDTLAISAHTPSTGSGWERLTVDWTGPENFRVAFNALYLRACMEGLSGPNVHLCGQVGQGVEDRSWAVIDPECDSRRAVISPVRLASVVQEPK